MISMSITSASAKIRTLSLHRSFDFLKARPLVQQGIRLLFSFGCFSAASLLLSGLCSGPHLLLASVEPRPAPVAQMEVGSPFFQG
jgi:energy-converting hydrogenase Eha subunit F